MNAPVSAPHPFRALGPLPDGHPTVRQGKIGVLLTNLGTPMHCDGKNWFGWPCDEEADSCRACLLDAECDDHNPCTDDSCDAGLCLHTAKSCSDGDSCTVDGCSLTVFNLTDDTFEVAVIPHTAEVTTFGSRAVGDKVNIEVDVLAKHVERLMTLSD